MRPIKRILYSVVLMSPLFLISGCNLFSSLHSDGKETNSQVLVADGQAAMKRGDYAKAAEYFRLAGQQNPRNSEARVGYAEAYLQSQGFSLGTFINALMTAMKENNTQEVELISPASWGKQTVPEVEVMLSTIIGCLDPIATGMTDGAYTSTDVNVNLTVGLFYILRVAAHMQNLTGTYTIKNYSKTSPEVASWGLSASVLAQLPDEFLWIADAGGNQPSMGFITSLQQDVSAGIGRLQVAADHSSSKQMLEDLIKLFEDWETLSYQ